MSSQYDQPRIPGALVDRWFVRRRAHRAEAVDLPGAWAVEDVLAVSKSEPVVPERWSVAARTKRPRRPVGRDGGAIV
ncbi:hypothetical protein [Streptomyces sp. SudanB182_2057]|uniref:hypothetical protein n=1 Tax=Streptomyces sp. SudanB182_2057 TaxID=3035281 RepID=UPI003F5790AE